MSQSELRYNVCKLPKQGGGCELIIKTSWNEENCEILLLDGENGYKGSIGRGKIAELSNQLGITVEDYIIQCKSALSSNGGHEQFIYLIESEVFQWKKILLDMKITFGYIQLITVPVNSTLHEMIDVSVDNSYYLKQIVSKLEEAKDLLENDNKELLQRIGDCINLKNDMESQLFSQFLLLLNEKKKKIIQLETQLKLSGLEVTCKNLEKEDNESEEGRRKLYETETEVDTDELDEEKEKPKTIKKLSKKTESIKSDSDSDTLITDTLPKRIRINKNSGKKYKDAEPIEREMESNDKCSSVFKQSNSKKRLSNDKGINNCRYDPGPSGVKMSKVTNKSKEVLLNKEREFQSRVSLAQSENNSVNLLRNDFKESRDSSSDVIAKKVEENGVNNKNSKLINQISEDGQKVSTVDDIIANLIG